MNKIAMYLQEHILGEVSTNVSDLAVASRDESVLEMTPEMVIYPRVTNDIRKVARFSWQLAEKGHPISLTPRGYGTDWTGAAIGEGIVLSLPKHMNRLFELDVKQKLVRLQPGLSVKSLNDALILHGVAVPPLFKSQVTHMTAGGAIANNARGASSGKYGAIGKWVSQLEVVLASGDVLQTSRLSKRELNKKKGLQTFEGEIYRTLDNLIEDNKELIKGLADNSVGNVGYASVAQVKQKDGSFDLTPLIIGSQGTLGIVSEMILKCEYVSVHDSVLVAGFASEEVARDMLDQMRIFEPAYLEYYDGELFERAAKQGKKYDFQKDMNETLQAVVLVGFDDFSERARSKKLKKTAKLLKGEGIYASTAEGEAATELLSVRDVVNYSFAPSVANLSSPPIVDGAFIPRGRTEAFIAAVKELGEKHQVTLPLHSRTLEGIFYARPFLQLHKVSDKQKIFRLLDEYSDIVESLEGNLIGEDGEGRLKGRFAYKHLNPELLPLFHAVKQIFDPFGTLNPGVKESSEVRYLASRLRS